MGLQGVGEVGGRGKAAGMGLTPGGALSGLDPPCLWSQE